MPAHEVGLAILGPLRELDEVAYLRFASVYRSFESADDFETEIALLRAERQPTGEEPDLIAPAQRLRRATRADAPAARQTRQHLHQSNTPHDIRTSQPEETSISEMRPPPQGGDEAGDAMTETDSRRPTRPRRSAPRV